MDDLKKSLPSDETTAQPKGSYDVLPPFNEGMLKVSDLHDIHYEQIGKEDGNPVIFM